LRNEKSVFKIREHTLKRIQYLVVNGEKEVDKNELAVRALSGKKMGNLTHEEFIALLANEIAEHNKIEPQGFIAHRVQVYLGDQSLNLALNILEIVKSQQKK